MLYQCAARIIYLREKHGMTQSTLAKKLKISRSAVNAWEMSLSTPSLSKLLELASIFRVSTDYILGLTDQISVDVSDLGNEEREIVFRLVECFKKQNKGMPTAFPYLLLSQQKNSPRARLHPRAVLYSLKTEQSEEQKKLKKLHGLNRDPYLRDLKVQALGLLVSISYTHYCASTFDLSNS